MNSGFCMLVDPLPKEVEIGGQRIPIRTDFRISILFELAMLDPDLSREQKLEAALNLYYEACPSDLEQALEQALWFYQCAPLPGDGKGGSVDSGKRIYDFQADDRYIYAAFLQQYGLDLTAVSLHWWQFRALFQSLPPDTMIMKIIGWRGAKVDPKGPKEEQERLRKLKSLYALPQRKSRSDTEKQAEIMQVLMNGGDLSAHSL